MNSRLYYVHDPMCSWCWAFRPVYERILAALPADLELVRLLGGLAPDNDEPMPASMREYLEATWRRIERRVPGTRFNFDFWHQGEPRRSTYPACRAVIAARLQGAEYESTMILAIQQAYYLRAMNPSDEETLLFLADVLGLNGPRFSAALGDEATQRQLEQEIQRGRAIGADGFPSLILERQGRLHRLDCNYLDAEPILSQIARLADL